MESYECTGGKERCRRRNRKRTPTWHERHRKGLTYGQRLADKLALGMGSWSFIIIQTVFIVIWIVLNFVGFIFHWDPYPFYSAQSALFRPGGLCRAGHHDVPEQAKRAGPASGAGRLQNEHRGQKGNRVPADHPVADRERPNWTRL